MEIDIVGEIVESSFGKARPRSVYGCLGDFAEEMQWRLHEDGAFECFYGVMYSRGRERRSRGLVILFARNLEMEMNRIELPDNRHSG